MKTTLTLAALLLCAPMSPFGVTPAHAADDPSLAGLLKAGPEALLKEADKRLSNWEDQTLEVSMHAKGPNDDKRMKMKVITRGEDRRALRFVEPADIRGMGVVIKGTDELYVRLPGSSKVRRVAAHARKQGLQGSDWGMEDQSLIRLSSYFTPTVKSKTATHIELELTRKAGVEISYPKLEVTIERASITVNLIRYFDTDGKALKEEVRTELKTTGDIRSYMKIKVSQLQHEHSTEIEVLSEKNNTGVKKKMFGKRWLVRGI